MFTSASCISLTTKPDVVVIAFDPTVEWRSALGAGVAPFDGLVPHVVDAEPAEWVPLVAGSKGGTSIHSTRFGRRLMAGARLRLGESLVGLSLGQILEQLEPLDVNVRKCPVQPPGQPPCGSPHEGHGGRDKGKSYQEGIDDDSSGQSKSDLLGHHVVGEYEAGKDSDHDQTSSHDHPCALPVPFDD